VSPRREPAGAPVGGRFTTGGRAEADVTLAPERLTSSATWPADHHFPRYVARVDALTAFDDDDGTYTIGDDLHVDFSGLAASDRWIGPARTVLAQLHRAGFVGQAQAHCSDYLAGGTDNWVLRLTTPSGDLLDVDVRQDYSRSISVSVLVTCRGYTAHVEAHPHSTPSAVDRQQLTDAVRSVLTRRGVETSWDHLARAASKRPWQVGSMSVRNLTGGGRRLELHPRVRQDVFTVVEADAAGRVTDVTEAMSSDRRPFTATPTGMSAGDARTQALANLGRRIGLGGALIVPERTEQMLQGALNPAFAPDLAWLDTNIAAVQVRATTA
jgi:hypothetical protein